MITVRKIGKQLGAEISGVNLASVLDDDTFAQVANAFFDNEVVFFRNQKLTPEQVSAIYERAFVHLNLNTATAEQILLVPRIARRMTREFEEYRPWVNFAQFDREIGKYVDATEVARLKQYVFIPLNLNTATAAQLGLGIGAHRSQSSPPLSVR